ncbi:MAG: hypothetical protein ABIO70_08195 [Pseudomonadota bacterium]
MIPLLLLVAAHGATDPAAYPLQAELDLPAADILRLDLPVDWVARCPDGGTYLLLDAAGRALPFAARDSDSRAAPRRATLRWEPIPTGDAWGWRVEAPPGGEEADALRLANLPRGGVGVVEVAAWGSDAFARQVVWNLPDTGAGVQDEVPLDAARAHGPWRVRLRWAEGLPWPRLGRDYGFQALLSEPWGVDTVPLEVALGPAVPSGETRSDRQLRLPRAGLPLRGLTLGISDPLFSRQALLLGAEGPEADISLGSGLLERERYGSLPVDLTRLALSTRSPAESILRVEDGRSEPLIIDSATVDLRGLALLVPGVEAGGYRLLGCGPEAPAYDLERLEERLAVVAPVRAAATAPVANPVWEAASVGAGLLAAGPALEADGFRWARPVTGGPGLVRVPLDEAVLAATRSGLPDLRFVDAAGHQLPFLLREEATGRVLTGLGAGREERGAESRLQLSMPAGDLPIRALVLTSDRDHFVRDLRLLQGPREGARPILETRWIGAEEGQSRLVARSTLACPPIRSSRWTTATTRPCPSVMSPSCCPRSRPGWPCPPKAGCGCCTATPPSRPPATTWSACGAGS